MSLSPKPAATKDSDVRDRIFLSALHHFSQKGYAATSLREIAEDARTTKPMIYYYFGSKEALYSNIVSQILEAMAEAIQSHLPLHGTHADQVMAYCERYLGHFLAQEEIIALVLREVFGLGGAPMEAFGQALSDRVRHPLDDIIREGMDDGVFVVDSAPLAAFAITGILNMFILAHVFGGMDIDRDTPLHQVRHYLNGLGLTEHRQGTL